MKRKSTLVGVFLLISYGSRLHYSVAAIHLAASNSPPDCCILWVRLRSLGSLVIALVIGEKIPGILWIGAVLLLGFVAYGLSINFYIKAQKDLGAAKTSAYYSIAPFLGVAFGMLLLNERPGIQFYVGLTIMIVATVLMVKDTVGLQHTHEHSHVHTHEHRHGDLVHTHSHEHVHTYTHIHEGDESSHDHPYEADDDEEHIHSHN